jgi:hypothetical protein
MLPEKDRAKSQTLNAREDFTPALTSVGASLQNQT